VLYESPYRLLKLLEEIGEIWPARRVVIARELTKKFEEFQRGTAAELARKFQEKSTRGEFVVLLEPLEP